MKVFAVILIIFSLAGMMICIFSGVSPLYTVISYFCLTFGIYLWSKKPKGKKKMHEDEGSVIHEVLGTGVNALSNGLINNSDSGFTEEVDVASDIDWD